MSTPDDDTTSEIDADEHAYVQELVHDDFCDLARQIFEDIRQFLLALTGEERRTLCSNLLADHPEWFVDEEEDEDDDVG